MYKNKTDFQDINLNVYSAIMNLNSYGVLSLVQKDKFDVLLPAGGVSLYRRMRIFSGEEKYELFFEAVVGLFNKNGKCLFGIFEEEIISLYGKISKEVLNSIPMFNAMLKNIEKTGRFFFGGLKLIHYEEINGHEKYFFFGNEYSFFSIIGSEIEFVTVDESGLDRYPVEDRDFFCQDDDLKLSHIDISLRELLLSFKNGGDLFLKFGREAHRVALIKLLDVSDFFVREENKDLIFIFEKLKRKFI